MRSLPAESNRAPPCLLVSALMCKQVRFSAVCLVPCFSLFFFFVISLFKMAPKCDAAVLSSVLSREGCDDTEEICV